MALLAKREDLVHVPWSSVEEWLQVYKQIYSGELVEQNQAYETLLVWKARIPKLPVGVECTLGLIQVCLRDREWTPKVIRGEMSMPCENDLRMMYSTVIMKFLNHISNIAHNKQISLFIIAKQLNVPDWIVDLRHDIAHGQELPSIDVMRIVANILLTWLHEEYWAAEAKNFQESQELEYFESEDEENLIELFELWTAVGLYIKTKHTIISDLPDTEIRNTLSNLFNKLKVSFSITDESELSLILFLLLSEISKNLNKGNSILRKEKIIIECILNNEAFLTHSEILSIFIEQDSKETSKNCLPKSLIDFWKDFFLLMQEKKILLSLFIELIEFIKKEKDNNKKLLTALWIKAIAQAFYKLKVARYVCQTLEQKYDCEKQKLSVKAFAQTVQSEVEKCYPELKNILTLNVTGDFPNCLTDATFAKRLIFNVNEHFEYFIPEILKISSFLDDSSAKEKLLALMKIHSISDNGEKMDMDDSKLDDKIYTVEDFKELEKKREENISKKCRNSKEFADYKIRNSFWELESGDHDWSTCPIGVLPWQQVGDYQPIEPLTVSPSEVRYAIVKNVELPRIVDSSKLRLHSKIQWENLLKRQKKARKKSKRSDQIESKEQTVTK